MNAGSDAARIGTCGHQMHEEMLLDNSIDPQSYLGRVMVFGATNSWGERGATGLAVTVTQELIDGVMSSVNFIRAQQALHGGDLLVEQSVPIGHITGEDGATGSADVILLSNPTLRVYDLKLGRHKVHAYDVLVPAHTDPITGAMVPEVVRANLQMAFYALGALEQHGLMHEFTHVSMAIVQPMVHHISEYTCTVDELLEVAGFLRKQAIEVRENPQHRPSAEACHWCRASGNCSAQTQMVLETALEGFDNVDEAKPRAIDENHLGSLYEAVPMIQDWCKAVEGRVRQRLVSGLPVVRNDGTAYKLVEGKNLPRKWADEIAAEAELKKMRLKQHEIYTMSLITPTAAEKLSKPAKVPKGEKPPKPTLGQRQWAALQTLIAQGQKGQPQVTLETDPRPALAAATEGFDDVPIESPEADDLFN